MLETQCLPVKTAKAEDSIWCGISEQTFRGNVVALQRVSNNAPAQSKFAISGEEWERRRCEASSIEYHLPFEVEQQIADDLALVAATVQGVEAVSAACLEEDSLDGSLVFRVAASAAASPTVRKSLQEICDLLTDGAQKRLSGRNVLTALVDRVVRLSRERIHAHLQSGHWTKPTSLKNKCAPTIPLHEEINRINTRMRKAGCCCSSFANTLCTRLDTLIALYRSVDSTSQNTEEELDVLKDIGQASNDIYYWWESQLSKRRDKNCCFSKAPIQQVGKIGRYWSLCLNLAHFARKNRELCANIRGEVLPSYQKVTSSISSKNIPVRCCVHAEIQMVAFYESGRNSVHRPRIIGSSKPSCYLCDLFVRCHGIFFLSGTHGQLHDRWTVPDSANYSTSGRSRIRKALVAMNKFLERGLSMTVRPPRNLPVTDWLDVKVLPTPKKARSVASSSNQSVSASKSSSSASTVSTALTAPSPTLPHVSIDPPLSVVSAGSRRSTCILTKDDLAAGQDFDDSILLNVVGKNIRLKFEIDESKRGRVFIGFTPPRDGCEVDGVAKLDAMDPGSSIVLERKPGCPSVHVEFQYGTRKPLFASLQWV